MAYTSEKALQYTKDTLSPMKDALLEGAQNGDIVIFTDGGIGKSQIKLCEPKGVALSSDYALENMGAVAGRVEGGRLMAYTSYKALAYTPDTLSQVKDKLTKGAPGGHLIIFTE